MSMKGSAEKAGREEGRVIASFDCLSKSDSAVRAIVPGSIAVLGAAASSLRESSIIAVIILLLALLPALVPILTTQFPRTKSVCTLTETGVKIKPQKPNSKARYMKWSSIAKFSVKPLGMKGGRIYLYPKSPFGLFLREVIEPFKLSDFNTLFNLVSSRVGMY